ncbi:MAG: hypothetical protein ABG776_15010 [Cyanobacteria bacterium J06555_13]
MAILIEAISVVIRCESLVNAYQGGVEAFSAAVPNKSLCADGALAGVSFMTPNDAQVYAQHLESHGLKHKDEKGAVDFVVVDQLNGFCSHCDWAIFGKTDWNNDAQCPISVCTTQSAKKGSVVVPNGWKYETSLSANHKYIDGDSIPENLKLIRKEKDADVFRDEETGKEFYMRRM